MALRTKTLETENVTKQVIELADAHCHLDLMKGADIGDAIRFGVRTMITNGVDTASNMNGIELADQRNVFAAAGVDPEHAVPMDEDELEFNISTIRSNAGRIVGIGEVGLDYKDAKSAGTAEKQKKVFARFLDLAQELRLPVSVHSRGALDDVMAILSERKAERVHIHFFEGSVQQAKAAERLGCTISVPPLESGRRSKVVKEMALERIMAESDSPIVGATPKAVESSVRAVAAAKGMSFESAAEALTLNTKNFFGIGRKVDLMRY